MRIGAQMYTVREFTQNEKGFADAIKRIASIGYSGVQISAIGDIDATTVRDICDSNGIEIVSTHTAPQKILNDTHTVIQDYITMGAVYVGLGSMPQEYRGSTEGLLDFINTYKPAIDQIKNAGLQFMYHNHDFEFEMFNGKLALDYLVDGLPNAGFTLDTYWIQAGGADPAWWLEKLSGRINIVHFKDMRICEGKQLMAEVLEGNLNWDRIFSACEKSGVQWAFVEQDDCYGADPFDCLARSYTNLKERGFK